MAELSKALAQAVGAADTGALRAALDDRGIGRLVLVVDQFEELFTLCTAESERRAFVRTLCAATCGPAPALAVVLGVRPATSTVAAWSTRSWSRPPATATCRSAR